MDNIDRKKSDPLTPLASKLRLSATLEINERVKQQRDLGRPVVHLGFGEANFPVHPKVLEAHRLATDNTAYLPVAGLYKLRESIARFQSRRLSRVIDAEQVVIAPGSKPLLFAFFDILDGDVMLPRPSWVSYEPQVHHAGKRLFWIETDPLDRHAITAESLQHTYDSAIADGGRPKILLVNSPSNPTGRSFSQETIDTITEFCQKHDIFLISDEIYAEISFEEASLSPCYGSNYKRMHFFLTGGLSKTHSAGGWRVGYAIFPKSDIGARVQTAILAYASECWSAASAPAQEAAAVAFDTTPELDLYRCQVSSLHKVGSLMLYEGLRGCGLLVARPQGAFYVYPSFQPFAKQLQLLGIKSSLDLSLWLLEKYGVAALPGSVFGELDEGLPEGRYRLRMASSGLYFSKQGERYEKGYDMMAKAERNIEGITVRDLPLVFEAIAAVRQAVEDLKHL